MGWLLLLTIPPALVLLLYFLPIRIMAKYDASGFLANLYVGPVRFQLYPSSGDGKTTVELAERNKAEKSCAQGAGGQYEKLMAYIRFAVDLLDDVRKKIVIKQLYFKITQAANDPFELAMKYGATSAAAGNLMALIEENFNVKKKEIIVCSDYLAEQTLYAAKFAIAISLGKFLRLYSKFSKRYFKEFNRILIIKKAVQTNESESS